MDHAPTARPAASVEELRALAGFFDEGRFATAEVTQRMEAAGPCGLLLRALAYLRRDMRVEALADARRALQGESIGTGELIAGARLLGVLGDYRAAIERLEQAAQSAPRPARLAILDAIIAMAERLGWYRPARQAMTQALSLDPSAARYEQSADFHFAIHDRLRGIADLRSARVLDPQSLSLMLKLAERLLGSDSDEEGAAREAIELLDMALPLAPPRLPMLLDAAEIYSRASLVPRALDRARACLERALNAEPERQGQGQGQGQSQAVEYEAAPGQEALLQSLLVPPVLPPGWRCIGVTIAPRITADYRHDEGDIDARILLAHPDSTRDALERTERFAMLLDVSRSLPPGSELRSAIVASLRAGDSGFAWQSVAAKANASDAPAGSPSTQMTAATAHARLGALLLWYGDVDGGRRHAEAALATDAKLGAAYRTRGAAQVLAREFEGALGDLDQAIVLDGHDAEAYLWRAEARLRLARAAEGWDDLVRGSEMLAEAANHLSSQILRLLVQAARGQFPGLPDHSIPETLAQTCPDRVGPYSTLPVHEVVELLERSLASMKGNRSLTPTFVPRAGDGAPASPVRILVKPSPRGPAKEALYLITGVGAEAAKARFAEVHARYPEAAEIYCYHGELYLYLGDYATARAKFEAALRLYSKTRWAFIGLAATQLLEGDPRRAVATLDEGAEVAKGRGPTTFVYRGEALRRLGKLDAAREELRVASEMNPSRVGAWVNLALVEGALGHGEAQSQIIARLVEQAPGLMHDAARELGHDAATELAALPGQARETLLEHVLVMKRGNRSSTCLTYFTASGELCVVPPRGGISRGVDGRELDALRLQIERLARAPQARSG